MDKKSFIQNRSYRILIDKIKSTVIITDLQIILEKINV